MNKYALLIDEVFKEIRTYDQKPEDISHKNVKWYDVVYEEGDTEFTGLENDKWVIRKALPTFEETKHNKLVELENLRWLKETGGTTFNGWQLATDPVSQTKYVGAVVSVQINPNSIIKWKMSNGEFVELSAEDVTSMAMAVRAHIQACFDKEAELQLSISSATNKEELDAIDITTGWPA